MLFSTSLECRPQLRTMLQSTVISDTHAGLSRVIYSEARSFLAKSKAEILLSAPEASASRFLLKAAVCAVVYASKDVLRIIQSHKRSVQLYETLVTDISMMSSDEPHASGLVTEQQAATLQSIFKDLDHLGRQSRKEDVLEVCAGMRDLGEFFSSLRASLQADLDSRDALSSKLARNMQMARHRISRMERNMTDICREVQTQFSSTSFSTQARTLAEVYPPAHGNGVATPETPRKIHDCSEDLVSLDSPTPFSVGEADDPVNFRANDAALAQVAALADKKMAPMDFAAKIVWLKSVRPSGRMWATTRGVASLLWLFKRAACHTGTSSKQPSCMLPSQTICKSNSPTSSENSQAECIMNASTKLPAILPELHRLDQVTTPKRGRKLAQSKRTENEHSILPNNCRLPTLPQKNLDVRHMVGRSTSYSLGQDAFDPDRTHDPFNAQLELCGSCSSDEPTRASGSGSSIVSKGSSEEKMLGLADSDSGTVAEAHDANVDRCVWTGGKATLQEPGVLHGQRNADAVLGVGTEAGSCQCSKACHHVARLNFGTSPSSHHFRRASEHLKRGRAGRLLQPISEPLSSTVDLQGQEQQSPCKHWPRWRRWYVLSNPLADPLELTSALTCESLSPSKASSPSKKAKQPGDVHFPCQPCLLADASPAHARGLASPPRKMSRLAAEHMQNTWSLATGA